MQKITDKVMNFGRPQSQMLFRRDYAGKNIGNNNDL